MQFSTLKRAIFRKKPEDMQQQKKEKKYTERYSSDGSGEEYLAPKKSQ